MRYHNVWKGMVIDMTKYEIRKVFSKAGSKIAVIILLMVMGITCFFASNISWVDEEGNSQNGLSAVSQLRAAQKEWSGYLDEERIERVIAENLRIKNTPEYRSQNVTLNNIAYSWGQGIMEIRSLLNCSFAEEFRTYDYYRADSLAEEDAANFYENRTELLKEWLEGEAKEQYSAEEKEYLIDQYDSLDTPFYYDYMTGWQQLFEFAPTIIMFTMLILGYLVAGIFSNEFAWKSDAVFFSSVYGRNKAVLSKIKAGFCIVSILYFAVFLLYTAMMLLYLGADGWNLPVQISWTSWKCLYHITNFQKYLLISIGGYVGCLFFSFLNMLISAKTRSALPAVMMAVIVLFIPSFLPNIGSSVINKIIGLLPDQLLDMGHALNYFNLYSIGGRIVGEVPVILILYTVLTIVICPVLYRTYRNMQIS